MEKVKAHDRYKHICYWVVQLLYFDGLDSDISTQVGLFDLMCVCPCPFIFLFGEMYVTAAQPQNQKNPLFWMFFFFWKIMNSCNTTPDPLVVVLRSAVRNRQSCGSFPNESTHFWGHTHTHKRDAGYFVFFFFSFLTSENKIYTISCFFFVVHWFLPQRTSL